MAAPTTSRSASAVEAQEVRQAVEKILASKYFVNAHQKKKFLSLICEFYLEARAHELNEYVLAYDVFGRDSTYSPSADPIVRVVAHDIRKKLVSYYRNEGANDPVHLEIPAGSYQPIFTRHLQGAASNLADTDTPVVPSPPAQAAPGWKRLRIETLGLSVGVLFLAIALLVLVVSNRGLRQKLTEAESLKDPAAYGEVWSRFLGDKSPPLVILSNPPVLRITNPSDPEALIKNSIPLGPEAVDALREKLVTNPEVSIKDSGGFTGDQTHDQRDNVVIKRSQTPGLILSTNVYTGMGEAIGLHHLTDFFRKIDQRMVLKQSRTLSAEDLKSRNVILLGGAWVNEWSGKLTKSEELVFTNKGTVENRIPAPGEEREYIPQFDSRTGNLMVDFALVTVKPNISEGNEVMLLAGVYSQGTEAAAEYVTNKNYLDQLNQRLSQLRRSSASHLYFQALLRVEVENGIPTTITTLAIRELRVLP